MSDIRLRDYQHADRVFVGNRFARSPKYKWLFHVHFTFSNGSDDIDLLVRTIELPKFTPVIKDMNQYNHKIWAQTQIKYEPVTIGFHDDNNDSLRKLWNKYYTYYFQDGTYTGRSHLNDDRYIYRSQDSWGMDRGVDDWFLDKVSIHSLHGGDSSIITLWRPVISSFTHDQHDNSDGQGIMEGKMTLHYTAVTYSSGKAMGTPGFGTTDRYDTNQSPLNGSELPHLPNVSSTEDPLPPSNSINTPGYIDKRINSTDYGYGRFVDNTANQLTNYGANNGFLFPTMNNYTTTTINNVPAPTNYGSVMTSNGQIQILDTTNLYPANSWQSALVGKGYSFQQISAADGYLSQLTTAQLAGTNVIQLAEQYILQPTSITQYPIGYGTRTISSQIDPNNPVNNTQVILNNQDWKKKLLNKGYTQAEIAIAAAQVAQLNINPTVDLADIAEKYILYNRQVTLRNQ